MRWAEVIMVRSAGSSGDILETTLKELINAMAFEIEQEAIRIFRGEKLDSDICIVLFHNGKKTRTGESLLGMNLTAALREVGLVNHTVWSEISR